MTYFIVEHAYYLTYMTPSLVSDRENWIGRRYQASPFAGRNILWFKDINEMPRKITSLRFTRVVFGLTSSPFLLNGTIKSHVSKYLVPHFTDIGKKLILNLYSDDSKNRFDSVETAIEFY